MLKMKACNLSKALTNYNENLVYTHLDNNSWSRQALWGYRVFDFWNHNLGVAIEVDGEEHDRDYDNYRDEYNFRRSGILVFRVRNNNQEDLDKVLSTISSVGSWSWRRKLLNIEGNRKEKRVNAVMAYDKNNLQFVNFMINCLDHTPYWYID